MVRGSHRLRFESLRRGMLAVILLLSGATALPVLAQPQADVPQRAPRTVGPEDILRLTDVSDTAISPDGRHIVYVTRQKIAHGPGRSTIWIVAADGSAPPRKLTDGAALEDSPQWCPAGDRIAFLSNRPNASPGEGAGEPSRQLWLIPADGGKAQPLTALDRDIRQFRWGPDGRTIAFVAPDPLTSEAKADRAAKRDWIDVDSPRDLSRLWVLDLTSRHLRRIAITDRAISDLNWSPDGKRLAVRAAATTGLNDHFYHSELLVLDAATGRVGRKLFDKVYSIGSWSPDGSRVAFIAPEPDVVGIRALVADVSSGAVKQLGATLDGTIRQVEWSRDNRTVLARVAVHTRDILYRVDVQTDRFRPLVAFDGRIDGFAMAKDGSIALTGNRPDRAADVWVYRKGALQLLTDINPQIRDWNLGKVEQVSWKSSHDGRPIHGVLVTPPASAGSAPRKTVVLAHGGPHDNWNAGWQGNWMNWAQLLASNGYVVLLPNPRGSSGQGTDFARGVKGGWGSRDYQDVADGVDMLIARNIADPSRVGIGGWSYGGFLSAWAVTHDTRFKTSIVGAAVTDPLTMALSTDTPDFVTAYFGLPPSAIAKMDASSPLRAVDRVNVPVLVLHGEQDRRVPMAQGLSFYRGLRLLGKDARMVIYRRESHWISEFENQLDMQRRVLAWFDAHL